MRVFTSIIGVVMIVLSVLYGLAYWEAIYGGIGLFGALITIPFSTILALFLSMFWSLEWFIGIPVYIGVAFWLINYGDEA